MSISCLGVSVRLTISNLETLAAAATRRCLISGEVASGIAGESYAVPRVCDLDALIASTAGKIEVDALEEGRDAEVIDHLMRSAILTTFKHLVPMESVKAVVDAFGSDGVGEGDSGSPSPDASSEQHEPQAQVIVSTGYDVSTADYSKVLKSLPALRKPVADLAGPKASAGEEASALELILEGLHLLKRLNKDASGGRASYRSRS